MLTLPLLRRFRCGGAASSRPSERRGSASVALLALLALSFGAPAAFAQHDGADDPRARAEAKAAEAEQLYEAGDYRSSLDRLTDARALYASPMLEFNFGLTYRALGRDADALAAFERFLAATSDRDQPLVARRREASWHAEALRARTRAAPVNPPVLARAREEPAPPPMIQLAPTAPVQERHAPRFYRRWWFWAAVGMVATGAAIAVVASSTRQPDVCGASPCALGRYTIP